MNDNDLLIREIANGVWFCLNLALAFTFWHQVCRVLKISLRECKSRRLVDILMCGITGVYNSPTAQAAMALGIYFTGSSIMRCWVWMLLLLDNRGDDIAFLAERYWIALLAAGITTTGALCCIRVFYPSKYGRWFWIGTGMIALIIPISVHYLVPY